MKNFLLAVLMFVGLTLGAGSLAAQCGGCEGGCEAKTAEAKAKTAKTADVNADAATDTTKEAKNADCGGCDCGGCGCDTSVAKRNNTPCGNRKAAATAAVVAEANKESGCCTGGCSGTCPNCGQGCECKDGKCENCGKKCCEGGGCKGESNAAVKEEKKAPATTSGK